jgi:hypothetical protein
MKRKLSPTGRVLQTTILGGLLAVGTVAYAQSTSPDAATPPANSSAPAPAPSGGWKRVGDHAQVYTPDTNSGAAPQTGDPNAPPPPDSPADGAPAGTYPGRNGRTAYPPINSAPAQQPNARQQNYPPQNYPAQSNSQPNYAPPPIPAQLTMPAGTYITVRVNQMLSSAKNQPGDTFTASLVQPLVVGGVVVAEPGQTVGGRVITAEKHHSDRPARLGVALTDLTLVDGQHLPLNTQFVSVQGGTTPRGQEVGTVAATTGVGAAIGAIAGWGTGAAIGAGAGAAAGLIGVLVTHNHASVLYPEQVLTFKLETPMTISTANSAQAFRYVQPNEYDRPTYANSNGGQVYQSAAPPPPVVYNSYPYYGGGWGWGYPYYWGPSFAFYGGYWGGRWYPRGYYPRSYYGFGGYRGGYAGGYRGGFGGGYRGGGGGYRGGGGHGGGHR